MSASTRKGQKECWIPGTQALTCKLPCMCCWELNLGPLEKHEALLTLSHLYLEFIIFKAKLLKGKND